MAMMVEKSYKDVRNRVDSFRQSIIEDVSKLLTERGLKYPAHYDDYMTQYYRIFEHSICLYADNPQLKEIAKSTSCCYKSARARRARKCTASKPHCTKQSMN